MRTRYHPRGRPRRTALLASFAILLSLLGLGSATQQATAADSLISQSRPVVASSIETTSTPAGAVVDGDNSTRWASEWSDPQWIRIDLGGNASISRVELLWEVAYASGYRLEVSPDAVNWSTVYSTANATGGSQTVNLAATGRYLRLFGTARATGYGYSLYEFKVFGSVQLGTTGYVLANPQVTGVSPSTKVPPNAYFHEFQANCSVTRNLPDDPIVFPGQAGASHMHTFLGSTVTDANSTLASLQAGSTSCVAPGDRSGYWMPTMYNGSAPVQPVGPQVIYYKTGVIDYTSVRPFPPGLRFVVGSPSATATEFATNPGYVAGWECGDSYRNIDLPVSCPAGTQINLRYQAPSCWNGLYLDTPDHKSHMAYPINGICPTSHPVALPMIEFKMAFPAGSGDLSQLHLSSGRGFSFHYDFFNAWDVPTLAALVNHCVIGGLQCDARGYDETQPGRGAALNAQYQLP
ncbi:DUF1996 domain-containing protein [Kitasatospora sp. P5_F3]